jgi:CRP-like cAMP-binding protein
MLENIKQSILSLVAFSEEDLMYFLSLFTQKKLKKYQFFLREGEICNQVAFVNTGLLRLYFLVDGNEHVDGFSLEGEWLTDYASFLNRQSSSMYIEALADTDLFLLSYDNIQKMYDRGKDFERFGRIIAEHLFVDAFYRGKTFALETPEMRYLKLLKEQPHLLNLVPLKQIASYLGIEPESLSRIRKRTNNKSLENIT